MEAEDTLAENFDDYVVKVWQASESYNRFIAGHNEWFLVSPIGIERRKLMNSMVTLTDLLNNLLIYQLLTQQYLFGMDCLSIFAKN